MSKAKINDKVKRELGIISGGRCQLCNNYLLEDFLTKTKVKFAEHAHIIADSSIGTRADEDHIIDYKEGVDNLMLLCPSCHGIIDNGDPHLFTVDYLKTIKSKQEARIKYLTEFKEDKEILNVIYHSKIGNKNILFERNSIIEATLNDGFYPSSVFIDLSSNTSIPDNHADYYCEKTRDLKNEFLQNHDNLKERKIMLFALAPQPLLIYLGCLLNKTMSVYPKQRVRKTESWNWEHTVEEQSFKVIKPKNPNMNKELCLLISLSDNVDISRVEEVKNDSDLWILTVEKPNMYSVTSKEQLEAFSRTIVNLNSEILKVYGRHKEINLFPVMPNSYAIEFGRVYMPKISNDLIIYDQVKGQSNNIFKRAFKLNELLQA